MFTILYFYIIPRKRDTVLWGGRGKVGRKSLESNHAILCRAKTVLQGACGDNLKNTPEVLEKSLQALVHHSPGNMGAAVQG